MDNNLIFSDLEHAVYLFQRSPFHANYTTEDYIRRVVPPLFLGQYMLWPNAVVLWAFVSNERISRLSEEFCATEYYNFQSGPNLLFTNFASEKGQALHCWREIKRRANAAGHKTGYFVRNGKLRKFGHG